MFDWLFISYVLVYLLGILSNGCLPFLQSDFKGVERGLAYEEEGYVNCYIVNNYLLLIIYN